MDTTDPDITFDEEGVCNHCRRYDRMIADRVFSGEAGKLRLTAVVEEIKAAGARAPYDCIIGVSGGVDSTFVALTVKRLGLRPLAVHLDNGWDSELAVTNISRALTRLRIDLQTHVIDWEEFRDLQLAFLKASTPDSEIPTDHAIIALLYRAAERNGVHYIVTGHNFRTESHHAAAWSQGHWDWRYIKAIHKRFGTKPLRTFPHVSLWQYWRLLRRRSWIEILNYLDYVKSDAVQELARELGWRYYGSKHHESIYTRFYQGYILPTKFNFDKRKSHFSSLICSGEMTREEALEALRQPPYPEKQQEEDRAYVLKKLGLSDGEFAAIMALPKRSYWDYPSYGRLYKDPTFNRLRKVTWLLGRFHRARIDPALQRREAHTPRAPPRAGVGPGLVLFTTSYPYDAALEATFIAPELDVLARVFEEVVVVPGTRRHRRQSLPAGVAADESLAQAFDQLTTRRAVLAGALRSGLLRSEVVARRASVTHAQPLRRLAAFSAQAFHTRRWVEAFLSRHADRPWVFYTYWLGATTMGVALAKGKRPQIRLVSRAHGYDLYEDRQDPPYLPCRRQILEGVDGVFTVSEHGRSYLLSRYPWVDGRCKVARLGVRDSGRLSRPSTDGVFRIVSCSYVSPVKRLELLLAGIVRAAEWRPADRFEWTHIGDGDDDGGLRDQAWRRAPANLSCRFRGRMTNEDVFSLYATEPVDLFANTSSSEGIPVSMMEAMSCGIPLMGTEVGGVPEIVTAEDGVLLPSNPTVDEIAAAILACRDESTETTGARRSGSRRNYERLHDAQANYLAFAERLLSLLDVGRERT